ncbi:hypothetical protein ED733_001833 [Metarhizium rileyi]|uniref:ATPase AAA-type core domain-containing protein n=1 Tax=Metarhizium rileyi (strain RCEF 4871) TaxID=1649241 RepID=A0A5C6FZR5_METRR|nr:hypothetical protein ED733_001833 [Metarhizium rileyi]
MALEQTADSFTPEKTSNSGASETAAGDVAASAYTHESTEMDTKAPKAVLLQDGEVGSKELDCPVTGKRHSSLHGFGLTNCPKCNKDISSLGEKNIDAGKDNCGLVSKLPADQTRSADGFEDVVERLDILNKEVKWVTNFIREEAGCGDTEDEDEKTQPENIVETEETEDVFEHQAEVRDSQDKTEDGFEYQVEFRDGQDNLLERQKWRTLVDLVDLSKGAATKAGKRIARITTAMRTSHSGDDNRSEVQKKKIAKAGFLNNPRVEIRFVKQYMYLESHAVIGALQKVVKYYPSVNLTTRGLDLGSPFCILVHHMDELEAFRATYKPPSTDDVTLDESKAALQAEDTERCSEVAFRHLGKILDFLQDHIQKQKLKEEQARHLQDPPVCTFPRLWLLYKPGTTVYVNSAGTVEAYVVESFEPENSLYSAQDIAMTFPRPSTLKLWNLSFDGTYIRRSSRVEIIGAFDGERPILDLKIVPAKFADEADGGKTREQLLQYGRKWYSLLCGAQQQHYFGDTMGSPKRHFDTRVVIDINSYSRIEDVVPVSSAASVGPIIIDNALSPRSGNVAKSQMANFKVDDTGEDRASCPCERCCMKRPHPPRSFPWAEYDVINPTVEKSLELPEGYADRNHRYLICTRLLMGFVLKSRTWEKLDVACCQPPRINVQAIDTLVMPEDRKRLIKAIVQKYTDPRFTPGKSVQTWGADFIEKCISELIGRPLLSLTCADFGIDEIMMEKNLSRWFQLAESWGAVMLLDEADVWLERRMISDLKRNTLVAVFLRCLEYYRGILFLTSNRVGTFDDAFISRIHVVIYYEDLGEEQRKQIWKQFFDKLERERKDTIIVESRAKHFVLNDSEMRKILWNGREIRNGKNLASVRNKLAADHGHKAFQTAVSLAEYRFNFEGGKGDGDMIVLDKVDFEQVCQMSIDFKRYLNAVHGGDETDRAMKDRIRA